MPLNTRNLPSVVVAVALLSLSSCGKSPTKLEKVFGGAANLEIVAKADSVSIYRVEAEYTKATNADLTSHTVLSGPVTFAAGTASSLKALLVNEKTYMWEDAKACKPQPGVVMRFAKGSEYVDILFCLECEELFVSKDGRIQGGEDFDSIASVVVEISKKAFPEDEKM